MKIIEAVLYSGTIEYFFRVDRLALDDICRDVTEPSQDKPTFDSIGSFMRVRLISEQALRLEYFIFGVSSYCGNDFGSRNSSAIQEP